jgi:zinc protease
MARLSHRLGRPDVPTRQRSAGRCEPGQATSQSFGRRVGLRCCLASAAGLAGLLACGDADPGFFTEPVPLPIADEPSFDPASYPRHRLQNGLATLMFEAPSPPEVSLGIRVRRGATSVERQHAGLAELTARAMRRGAGDRDAKALTRALRKLGATPNIDASWDSITIRLSGPSENIREFVEILADIVIRPHLDDEGVEHALRLQLTKVRNAPTDRPKALLKRYTARALYPNHRVGFPLEGTEPTLRAISTEDIRNFHSEIFVAGNALFFASGAFDADELLALVTEEFGSWPGGPMPPAATVRPASTPSARQIVIIDRPRLAKSTHVLLAQDGITRQSASRAQAHLLNEAIELSTIIQTRGDWRMHRDGGSYTLSSVTASAKAGRVVELLIAELERARTQPISQPEIELAREQVLGRLDRSLPTEKAALKALIELDSNEMPDDSRSVFRAGILAATPKDLQRQARRLLHPERTAIIVVGPAAELVPQFEGLGPIEVIEPPPDPAIAPSADEPPAEDDAPDGSVPNDSLPKDSLPKDDVSPNTGPPEDSLPGNTGP